MATIIVSVVRTLLKRGGEQYTLKGVLPARKTYVVSHRVLEDWHMEKQKMEMKRKPESGNRTGNRHGNTTS